MSLIRRALTWLLCLALAGQQAAALAAVPCEHAIGEAPAAIAAETDAHGEHAMHAMHGMQHSPDMAPALDAPPNPNDDGCDCGCAMMACAQTASSMLPSELVFAKTIPPSDSPLSDARTFVLERERATLLRPPIAA